MSEKISELGKELDLLSAIAKTQPHAAYAAYTHGLTSKWSYLSRTTPNLASRLQVLEDILRSKFIPCLTGRPPPNDAERNLLALPVRLGGLGIANPSLHADQEHAASLSVTAPLRELFNSPGVPYSFEVWEEQFNARSAVWRDRDANANTMADELKEALPPSLKKAMCLASEKGASSWLTTLPIKEHGFTLHKGGFVDALCLRYGWPLDRTPIHCECGKNFTVEHVLSCPLLHYVTMRSETSLPLF